MEDLQRRFDIMLADPRVDEALEVINAGYAPAVEGEFEAEDGVDANWFIAEKIAFAAGAGPLKAMRSTHEQDCAGATPAEPPQSALAGFGIRDAFKVQGVPSEARRCSGPKPSAEGAPAGSAAQGQA